METHKYVEQTRILTFAGCFVTLHERDRQKPEERGPQVAAGAAHLTSPPPQSLPSEQSGPQQSGPER